MRKRSSCATTQSKSLRRPWSWFCKKKRVEKSDGVSKEFHFSIPSFFHFATGTFLALSRSLQHKKCRHRAARLSPWPRRRCVALAGPERRRAAEVITHPSTPVAASSSIAISRSFPFSRGASPAAGPKSPCCSRRYEKDRKSMLSLFFLSLSRARKLQRAPALSLGCRCPDLVVFFFFQTWTFCVLF